MPNGNLLIKDESPWIKKKKERKNLDFDRHDFFNGLTLFNEIFF